MIRKLLLPLLLAVAFAFGLQAQVTSSPSPLQEDSQNVVIYFHADQGNKKLMNQPATASIYAHTGVITNTSTSGSDWKYTPTWGDNSPKYKLEYVSPNLWKLNIGDIRTYYGITDPAVSVTRLAFVFRNANNSLEGKAEGDKDIFLDVLDSGLQVALESSLSGTLVSPENTSATFSVGSTRAARLTIAVNGQSIGEAASATELKADWKFSSYGTYTVTASAETASGQKAETSRVYSYLAPSVAQAYPGGGEPKMGAVRNADGSVTFCIAAPSKSSVFLCGSWNDYTFTQDQAMAYDDRGAFRYFWTTVKGLDPDTQYLYYYVVDYSINVGDPYARLVLDPQYDRYIPASVFPGLPTFPSGKVPEVPLAIYHENMKAYDWKYTDSFRPAAGSDLLVYELLFRDFTGTEGQAKGDGTIRQALSKVRYLSRLGVNAVELLPVNEFNGNISWGYNPNFYFAPDKAYGTPSDLKEFIDLCHSYGIAVILDVVFNQADWQHPWYQMYNVGSNPFFNASAPHAYSVLNDWNQGYGLVQQQWHDVLQYWLEEYRVDGFRFDLVKGLGDNDSYANSGDAATNAYNASRVARMRELQLAAQKVRPDVIFINENLAGAKEENEMAAYGQLNWMNLNNAGCQFAMGYQSESSLSAMYAPLGQRNWGSTVSYLESHDEQRLAYKQDQWGTQGVKGNVAMSMRRLGSAAAQMIMAPGAHMIWQFSELGDAQNNKNSNGGNNTDPKRVVWNYLDDPQRVALHDSYMELLHLRRNNPELFTEEAVFDSRCSANDWNNGRYLVSRRGDREIITVVNPSPTASVTVKVDFTTKDNNAYQILSRSHDTNPSFSASAGTVTLEPGAYAVIGSRSIVGVGEVADTDSASMSVFAADGRLCVAGAQAPVSVFSTDGCLVARSDASDAEFSLPAGLYIVVSGQDNAKIFVK